jgi:putative hydrolase of the HAD superfamily
VSGYILWDFEGTIARRRGRFAEALQTAAGLIDPSFKASPEILRPYLSAVLPWNRPNQLRRTPGSSIGWWTPLLEAGLAALLDQGMHADAARNAVGTFKEVYLDATHWELMPNAEETLESLTKSGWRHAMLSNFAPELDDVVQALGITKHFDHVISSARIGHEKPTREAFQRSMDVVAPDAIVWMVGDNLEADIAGASSVGLSTILVGPRGLHQGLVASHLGLVPSLISGLTANDGTVAFCR